MARKRTEIHPFWPLGVVAGGLLFLYVSTYFAMVRPAYAPDVSGEVAPLFFSPSASGNIVFLQRPRLRWFFTPVHWVDRHLRPGVWTLDVPTYAAAPGRSPGRAGP